MPPVQSNVQVVALGGNSDSTPIDYTYLDGPTVTNVVPNTGTFKGGTSVTITGTGFGVAASLLSGPLAVTFGGTPAASYTWVSDTEITAVTPPRPLRDGAGAGHHSGRGQRGYRG